MPEMRGLIWPTYSYPGNVSTDSLYLISRNLILQNPEVHWYLLVPDWEAKRDPDELDDCDWCTMVPTPMKSLYRTQESVMDPDTIWRFAPQEGELPVEFAVIMSPQRTLNLANAWSIRSKHPWRPVLVNYDLLQRDDRDMEYAADPIELLHCAAGFAVGDLNVHESAICEWMTTYNARRWLQMSQVREIQQRSVTIEQGVPLKRLDEHLVGPKREKFTVYYGGRFAESKRFGVLADVIDAAYRFGREMDFVVCTGSLSGIVQGKFKKRFPQVELHVGTNQYEAWEIMSTCHAALCLSRGELFGLAFWEQIAAGIATVMKTERWNEGMLPEEYPLWTTSKDEAAAMLRLLYEQHERDPAQFVGQWSPDGQWAQYVRGRYDADTNLRTMGLRIMEEVQARRDEGYARWGRRENMEFLQLVEESVEDGMTLPDVIEAVRGKSRIGKNVVGQRLTWGKSLGMLDLYRMVRYLGWKDVGGETPRFVKGASDG